MSTSMTLKDRLQNNEAAVFIIPLVLFAFIYLATNRGRADYTVLLGTLLISFILVPTLLDNTASLPRTTSVPAFVAVVLLSIGTADAGLYLSALANAFSAILWLLVIKYRPT